ncbi:hypothetical protein [Pontibacter cellulosilyticus]|uniref:Uncharacterized protein n=1 Tax=Pontibacter cellulosilyticus TaxID=1720253 RepID=A0A923N5Y6_9BACT|nr:hypothetical protein [Pontibacter cellulosilyticus]MBC5993223.1 hypothetical protein [Pontibacter cellulosilyticus]
MKPQIDTKYRTERLLEWEVQSLSGKYGTFSLSKKSTWVSLGIIFLVIFVSSFIMPFFPPRYGWGNWSPPKTLDDYESRVSSFLIVIPLILLIGLAYLIIRNTIDLNLGIKRTANFKVTDVIDLGGFKILILNEWRLFILRNKDNQFNTVAKGQVMNIKRTGTYRLISYYVRDEEVFFEEQKRKLDTHNS